MRIVVCVKEVLDPDAVNNYALAGNLKIGDDGKSVEVAAIPRLINGYDEQALEAALRLRDQGIECAITAVTVAAEAKAILKHCAALGADQIVAINPGDRPLDGHVIARILAAYVQHIGGADLVLCGRQASDDDQGVVPMLLAERLGLAVAAFARDISMDAGRLRVTRVTTDGDEVVAGPLPALVTVSNELGTPRFPTAKAKMAARKMKPVELAVEELGLDTQALIPRVIVQRQYVPVVQGNCEFLEGSPAELARELMQRLGQS